MKLEIGMYFKTKKGYIGKIFAINVEVWPNEGKRTIYEKYKPNIRHYPNSIIKASHNIIDLIEVGDYVNGHRIYNIVYGKLDLEGCTHDNDDEADWYELKKEDKIVTKLKKLS